MTTFGIVCQRAVPAGGWEQVRERIAAILDGAPGVHRGLSCLHPGAETIFAEELVRRGGALVGMVPGAGYVESFSVPEREVYERWRDAAEVVFLLLHQEVDDEASLDAALSVTERSEVLIVVWDGLRSEDGVPDQAVAYAQELGVPTELVWVGDPGL